MNIYTRVLTGTITHGTKLRVIASAARQSIGQFVVWFTGLNAPTDCRVASFLAMRKRLTAVPFGAVTIIIVMLLNAGQAQARAWEWAKRLPLNQYSQQDIEILKQSMAEILGSLADGEPGEWSNPETGHGGTITPLTTVHQNDKLCRQTRFTASVEGQENKSDFFLCRQADGVWAVEQPVLP